MSGDNDRRPPAVVELSKIQNYGEKAEEITGEVINYLDNFDDLYRQENAVVNDAIEEMGDIDLSGVIGDLNKMKLQALPLDAQKKMKDVPIGYRTGKKAIDDYLENVDDIIDDITGQSVTGVARFNRPASEVLKLRRKIDETVNFNKSNYSTDYARKLEGIGKKARAGLKGLLEKSASETNNPEYIDAMGKMSKLSDVRDRIVKMITGKDGSQDKAKNFLISLGNPDKIDNIKLATDLEKILGKELFKDARLMRLAKEYRDGLGVFTDIQTGKSNYLQSGLEGVQKVGAMALGSPKFGGAPLTGALTGLVGKKQITSPTGEILREGTEGALEQFSPLMRGLKASYITGEQ